jgi:hypothetical protein
MCPHGRRKARCKDCGGSAICIHDRVKYTCRFCKTKSASKKQVAANLAAVCGGDSTETEGETTMVALVRATCKSHVVQSEQ